MSAAVAAASPQYGVAVSAPQYGVKMTAAARVRRSTGRS